MKTLKILSIIGMLILAIFACGCVEQTIPTAPTINQLSPVTKIIDTPNPIKVVDTTPYINITYSHKVQEYIGMKEFGSASGKIYLIITMDIENHGYDNFDVNPFYWSVISNGVSYSHHYVTYQLDNPFGTESILNDGKLTGSITFEIPKNGYDKNTYEYLIKYMRPHTYYNIKWNYIQ